MPFVSSYNCGASKTSNRFIDTRVGVKTAVDEAKEAWFCKVIHEKSMQKEYQQRLAWHDPEKSKLHT